MEPDSDTLPEVQRTLNKPLHPALVRRRSAGRQEQYLPTHTAITQANRIIGALEWSTEIVSHEAIVVAGECIGYKCIARVTVPKFGFQVEGVGFNSLTVNNRKDNNRKDNNREDNNKPEILQTPDSHDTAIKGAESDAIKRALRDPFANHLYETAEERRDMARAAVPIVARRMGINYEQAENIVKTPYRNLDDVPLNISMGHYYGTDAHSTPKSEDQGREQNRDQAGERRPNPQDSPAEAEPEPQVREETRREENRREENPQRETVANDTTGSENRPGAYGNYDDDPFRSR